MRTLKRKTRIPFSDVFCSLAALLPCFGFFGFLLMGERSGRTRYRRFAAIYACANAALFLLFLLYRLIDYVLYKNGCPYSLPSGVAQFLFFFGDTGQIALAQWYSEPVLRIVNRYTEILFPMLRTLLYFGCLIHTAVSVPGYCRYLSEAVLPFRVPQADIPRKKRFASRLWMLWCLAPGFSFAAPLLAARRIKNRRMQRVSGVLLGVCAFCLLSLTQSFISLFEFDNLTIALAKAIENRIVSGAFALFCTLMRCFLFCAPLVSFLLCQTMLPEVDRIAEADRKADAAAHPVCANRKWRLRNGARLLWSLLPFIGGLGMIAGGAVANNRRARMLGALHLLISLLFGALMIALYYAGNRFDGMPAGDPLRLFLGVRYLPGARVYVEAHGFFLLWMSGVALCCAFRRELLLDTAEALGGDRSPIDREIRLSNRFRALGALPLPEPAMAGAARTVNLNACSASEAEAIPGMSAAAAARVMRYRKENGGIRSERELLDVLDEKPHRAARILEHVTFKADAPAPVPSSESVPSHAPQDPVQGESRRRIDL